MHTDTGQYAIAAAELTAEFKRAARYEDQESRVYDKQGSLLFAHTDVSVVDRPEIDRAHLRQLLLDSLPDGAVRWNHALSAAERREGGKVELVFRNGAREQFDLVVGADGAWSRVRPLLSEAQPIYTGVMFIEFGIDDIDARYPEIATLVGRGLTFALGDSKALIAHRDANAHIGAYAGFQAAENWAGTAGFEGASSEARREILLEMFAGWSEDLLNLIRRGGGQMTPRPLYTLPVGYRWEHMQGATLLGDAAHLMSPFSGEGANLAMRDAADLAHALTENADWDAAVRGCEELMAARAEQAAAGALDALQSAFSEDGLTRMLEHMGTIHNSNPSAEQEPR